MAIGQGKAGKIKLSKQKIIIIGVAIILAILIGGFAFFQYAFFKARAEGIAIGYEKAATSAYQMGRPLPNNIFEEDNYRVEIISSAIGQPFFITINVRDKYTNITHYSRTNSTTPQGGTVTPVQSASPENK